MPINTGLRWRKVLALPGPAGAGLAL